MTDLLPRSWKPGISDRCEHRYMRFRNWPIKDRYRCIDCGFITRLFDSVDGMMMRPIHTRMSVACHGVNILPGRAR